MRYIFILLFFPFFLAAQTVASFEELNLPLDTFLNDARPDAGYQTASIFLPNQFNPDFGGFWESGWAISTMRDDSTTDFTNLYSAKISDLEAIGRGFESNTYIVGQQNAILRLNDELGGRVVEGVYITNGVYPHGSMLNGDDFAKKFGGVSGDDPDFFRLDIQKFSNGVLSSEVIEFYLADFRFEDNSQDFIVDDWQWIDLSSLGNVDSLLFTLQSSDVGDFGINTPLFFCLDNLIISNEISTSNKDVIAPNLQMTLFPNPASEAINLNVINADWQGRARIFDALGRLVNSNNMSHLDNNLNIEQLPIGIYTLSLWLENGQVLSQQFLKIN